MVLPGSPITGPRILVALDFDTLAQCEQFLDKLDPSLCRVKIGKELFTASGPAAVKAAHSRGFDVFLDLKFHDIPATVAKAAKAAADLGVWMVNVHGSGGPRMLAAAAEALANHSQKPYLIGVTVLTSMGQDELNQIGVATPLTDQVLRLAGLVKDAGLHGVVCSALEAEAMKARFGENFVLVTPGIRPEGSPADDQRRIVTPKEAVRWGSDYLVIGRPITQAADPVAVCREIAQSLA
ncbi:MAG: orotidine-5'-phosphate decarboxylase [Cellvibrionaceae bacterium]|nr:orotidine-5'-phosphate decarboxylase [Cellvibrionaceae bacterium]